ncbi:aminopeptidase [Candidatus Woesearchaeota archaeon]|nr:aminopeptidase [Candidatus Woesearchaeota archaeon]
MYQPSKQVLDKYADLLINFALNRGNGIKKGDVVLLQVPECAKPLLVALRRAVLKAGGHSIIQYIPDGMQREFYELANENQLKFFPGKQLKGLVDQIDYRVAIISDDDPKELMSINPTKIMARNKSFKPYKEWQLKKENESKYTWVLALYGTPGMAKEANLSLEAYWQEIIKACYLDKNNPVAEWRKIFKRNKEVMKKLNDMRIVKVHVEAPNTDLHVGIGENRVWASGSGMNIPSFEIFTSPNCKDINGHIQFTEPLYREGNLIKNVYLRFEKGVVVEAKASSGEKFLKEMIKVKNANRIGEFSMTDGRMSKITKFMAETLFDENVGGEQGNMHMAIGDSFQECYRYNTKKMKKKSLEKYGFNSSVIHTDIVATSKRKITATLKNGTKRVIYENGKFLL